MNTPFLTIAEAVEKTGRSPSTIRRVIRGITDAESHPDRDGVLPSPAEAAECKKKGENFAWKIREDILTKQFSGAQKEAKKSLGDGKDGILDILSKELELKNQQIEKQWEVIHALNDRLREGNILMASLQQKLTLPSPDSASTSTVEAGATRASTATSKTPAKAPSTNAKKEASAKPSRRGILAWLRR